MSEEIKPRYKKTTLTTGVIPKSTKRKEAMYVNNEAMYQAFVERRVLVNAARENGSEMPRVSEFIGECFLKIANNFAKKYQFANYSYRDELVADALIHCLRYVDSFDPEKSQNPFSYFTQTCYYQFLERIKEEKKEAYVKYRSTLESAALGEVFDNPDVENFDIDMGELDIDYMTEYCSEFEAKAVAKANNATTARKVSKRPCVFEEDSE